MCDTPINSLYAGSGIPLRPLLQPLSLHSTHNLPGPRFPLPFDAASRSCANCRFTPFAHRAPAPPQVNPIALSHLTWRDSTQTSPLTASAYLCDTYFLLLSLFPSRTPPAHISTQSHPFSFPSSTNHLHRLQARPGGHSASPTHTCTPLFGGTTVERPGTPRNVIFQSLLPLPLTPSSSSPPAPPRSRTTTPPRFRDAHLFLIGWRRL